MLHRILFENPGPLFIVIFLASRWMLRRPRPEASTALRTLGVWFGGIALLAFLAVMIVNVLRGGLLWHDEANILSIAAAWHNGQPMYPLASSGDFYALFYGPVTYLLFVPLLLHDAAQSLLALRVVISVVNVASVAFLYSAVRSRLPRSESVAVISVAIAVLLPYPDQLLGLRGDPWLLFFSSLAAMLVMRCSRSWALPAMLIAGIAMGLAIDLKVTVVPVMCVAAAIALRRLGWLYSFIAAIVAAVVSGGVFLLHGISLTGYARSLQGAGHQGFLRSTLLLNLFVLLLLLLPVLHPAARHALAEARRRGHIVLMILVSIAVLVCVMTGSKFSAGPWHLWPLIPFLLPAAAWALVMGTTRMETDVDGRPQRYQTWLSSLAIAGGITALLFCAQDVRLLHPLMSPSFHAAEAADLAELRGDIYANRGRNLVMGMGSNVNDERTNLRYELQRHGLRYMFDENEVIEGEKESLPPPDALIARIRSCEDDWLMPHGDEPFSAMRGGLVPGDTNAPMYSEEFRSSFFAAYKLQHAGTAYDVWSCRSSQTERR